MKKLFYILTAALLTSCMMEDDFLDKKPLNTLSEEAVFNSAALAESFINAAYSVLPDPYQEGNISSITDESYFRYGGTSTRYIASGQMTPSNVIYMEQGGAAHNSRTTVLNIWNRAYESIYNLNYFLKYVNEKGSKIDQASKDRLVGEAYCLRAWSYYNLIQRYAGVPIIKTPHNLDSEFGVKRSNFDDCVDFILEDLVEAERYLPTKDECRQGRLNKDVALAIRARVTLLAASKLFNNPTSPDGSSRNPEGDIFYGKYDYKGKWQRAFEASQAMVDRADKEGAYSLDPSYEGFWYNTNSPEIIWAKYLTPIGPHKAQLYYAISYYSGWSSMEPTQTMQIDYEMANGKKFFEEGSGYDPEKPYANRDPRFYMSCAAPGDKWYYTNNEGFHEVTLEMYWLYQGKTKADFLLDPTKPTPQAMPEFDKTSKDLVSDQKSQTTGLQLNKWYLRDVQTNEDEIGSKLYPWFRLGEFYLNLAECAWHCKKYDVAEAYVDKVRARAGMPPINTQDPEHLWDRIMNERRIELAFEFTRYFDLRRWMVADFYENIPVAGMRTMRLENNGNVETIYRMARVYDESKNNTKYYWNTSSEHSNYIEANFGRDLNTVVTYKWLGKEYTIDYGDCALTITPTQKYFPADGRNYLMPIPQDEITKSKGSLVQNPHYDEAIPTAKVDIKFPTFEVK